LITLARLLCGATFCVDSCLFGAKVSGVFQLLLHKGDIDLYAKLGKRERFNDFHGPQEACAGSVMGFSSPATTQAISANLTDMQSSFYR